MNRQQKIDFLTRLMTGKASIEEILQHELCMKIGYGPSPIYFVNGKEVSHEEYAKYSNPGTDQIKVTVTYVKPA